MGRNIFVTDKDEAIDGLREGSLMLVDCGVRLRKDREVVRNAMTKDVMGTFEYMDSKLTYDDEYMCELIAVMPYIDDDVQEILDMIVERNCSVYIGKRKTRGLKDEKELALREVEFKEIYRDRIAERKAELKEKKREDFLDKVATEIAKRNRNA